MEKRTRSKRIQVQLTEGELAAILDWQFANRIPNRTAAVRDLLQRGLAAERPITRTTERQSDD